MISRMSTSMSRASFVIWSKLTGALPGSVVPAARAGAPTGPGISSMYLSPSIPRLWIEAEAPLRSSTSRVELEVHQRLSADEPDLGSTFPTQHPCHADVGLLLEPGDVVELDRHQSCR